MSKFTPTERISILVPKPSVMPRGANATKKADPQRSIRISDDMYDAMHDAAAALKMSAGEFIRWTAYLAANEIIRQYNEHVSATKLKAVKPSPITLNNKPKTTIL